MAGPGPMPAQKLGAAVEEAHDARDVVAGLAKRRNAAELVDRALSSVVRGKGEREIGTETLQQHLEMLHAGVDVVLWVVQIEHTVHRARRRHQLHQPFGAFWRHGAAVIRRFHLDYRMDDPSIDTML